MHMGCNIRQDWVERRQNSTGAQRDAYTDLKMVQYRYFGDVGCEPACKEVYNVKICAQNKNGGYAIPERP